VKVTSESLVNGRFRFSAWGTPVIEVTPTGRGVFAVVLVYTGEAVADGLERSHASRLARRLAGLLHWDDNGGLASDPARLADAVGEYFTQYGLRG
jgi:hypothetical protein